MLLSYEQYQKLGGTLPENQFLIYEELSEAELNAIGNGALPRTITVQSCIMIMIEAYSKSDYISANGTAESYSNDGVSVKYSYTETPSSLLDIARQRVMLLFQKNGITRYLGVRHRE